MKMKDVRKGDSWKAVGWFHGSDVEEVITAEDDFSPLRFRVSVHPPLLALPGEHTPSRAVRPDGYMEMCCYLDSIDPELEINLTS